MINPVIPLRFAWELPQCLFAAVLMLIAHKPVTECCDGKAAMVRTGWSFSFALGFVIFLGTNDSDSTIRHEYGHTRQSLRLGWIYLLAVGIPSVILFWIRRLRKYDSSWYLSKYPESWADKLGGVKRN